MTIPALIVLTLAIGATTALFSVVDAVVLRGLPFDQQDRLVAVGERRPLEKSASAKTRDVEALLPVAPENYLDWAEHQQVFEGLAAIASGWLTLHRSGGQPESLIPHYVSGRFFDLLRAKPALGRTFTADDEPRGAEHLVVLSDGLWRRTFGADPQIVGKAITLDDVSGGRGSYTVVGVMPPGFAYPVGAPRATDIWLPFVVPANQRVRSSASRVNYLQVIGRLAPGVSIERAQAQMNQIAAALEKTHPQWNKDNLAGVRPLRDHLVGTRIRAWMLMLLGAVGIVLVIACANVSNLLLVHATSRERDVSVRIALGATRWRLVRQLVAESVMLSFAAALCGLILAFWGIDVLRQAMPDNVPRAAAIAINIRVFAACAGVALITGLVFGIVPALQGSRPDLTAALKDGGRTGGSPGRQRLRSALVIAEVALALVLLVGAALFIGSFIATMRIEPGFEADRVLTAQVSPPVHSTTTPRDWSPELGALAERVGALPGVVYASVIGGNVPLLAGYTTVSLTIPSRGIDLMAGENIATTTVSPAYHQSLGIPLRRGRLFERTDRKDGPQVVLINESAARKYFPNEDPIGGEIGLDRPRTIVGIVGDIRQTSLEIPPRPEVYVPLAQGKAYGGSLVVRTIGEPYEVLREVKAATFAVLPDVPLRNVITMEELIGKRVAQRRLTMLLLGLFGALGLLISAVGVYGVMAYTVAQRTREIGIRMALGATASQIRRMIVRSAAGLVLAGVFVGAAGAWYLSVTAEVFLFGVQATDPRAFAASVALLAVAALAASVIPGRRAVRVDPIVALRAE